MNENLRTTVRAVCRFQAPANTGLKDGGVAHWRVDDATAEVKP